VNLENKNLIAYKGLPEANVVVYSNNADHFKEKFKYLKSPAILLLSRDSS
jgi:hypothetical protein